MRNGEQQCGLVGREIGRHDSYVTNYVRNGEEQCGLESRYERRHDLNQLRAQRCGTVWACRQGDR